MSAVALVFVVVGVVPAGQPQQQRAQGQNDQNQNDYLQSLHPLWLRVPLGEFPRSDPDRDIPDESQGKPHRLAGRDQPGLEATLGALQFHPLLRHRSGLC